MSSENPYFIEVRRKNFAVRKTGKKRAVAIFIDQEEAEKFIKSKWPGKMMRHYTFKYYNRDGELKNIRHWWEKP